MKLSGLLLLSVCFVACSPSKVDQKDAGSTPDATSGEAIASAPVTVRPYNGEVVIEVGDSIVGPTSYADKEVIAKNQIEYFPGTDRVKNLDEVEPSQEVGKLFDRPFINYDIRIVNVDDEGGKFRDINKAMGKFGIVLSESQLDTVSRANEYEHVRIKTKDIAISLLKVSSTTYEIWFVEVPASGAAFESSLPLDLGQQDIQSRLGEPNFKTKDGNVFIYSFFTSLRQFNIIWTGGKVDRIQYITWDGI